MVPAPGDDGVDDDIDDVGEESEFVTDFHDQEPAEQG
jgi:hypothetical protein